MLTSLVETLSLLLNEKHLMLVTAESCTGGTIASAITDRSGSASIFERGFVTYSNDSKIEMLGVNPETLKAHGAVSEETATEMARGARKNSHANIALSVTGIAGPTGGSEQKPVGLVYIGYLIKDDVIVRKYNFKGDRAQIRKQAAAAALSTLIELTKAAY